MNDRAHACPALCCSLIAVLVGGPVVAAESPSPAAGADKACIRSMDSAASKLAFATAYEGDAIEGRFESFAAAIAFNPERMTGRFDVTIEIASATTRLPERDEVLLGDDFLAVAKMPQARYTAESFRADGASFIADGELSLKGVELAVPMHFTWSPAVDGKGVALVGHATVPRLAFNVGSGDWADPETIPDDVAVSIHVQLGRCPAAAAN